MSSPATPTPVIASTASKRSLVAMGSAQKVKSWTVSAHKLFGTVHGCPAIASRWPRTSSPPQVLAIHILATKDTKLTFNGIDFGGRAGVVRFLRDVLEIDGLNDVVQPLPYI
jgi:hypothetical protein